jgi:protein dithiol oxidoreductase (disulfide-forming)
MKRREFALGTTVLLGATACGAQTGNQPKEGKDFLALDKRAPVDAQGKIEVVEFFWYGCPHCNAFEPQLANWLKALPKDVQFRRVPVAFRTEMVPEQQLFYSLEALNEVERLHTKVFQTIHADKQPLNTPDRIAAWVEKQGMDKAKFMQVFQSFGVQAKARRAAQLQDAYQVAGVPALGVAGRYYTDGSLTGSMDRALQVTDHLIGEARKGK